MYLRALFTARPVWEALEMGLTLGVSVSFFVSVVNSQVYTVYKYIYLFSLYAYIQYYFCTDLYGQMDLFFFHKGCYYNGGLLPHLFAWLAQKKTNFLNWSVISTLLLLLLKLQSKHCNFVIPTCELWNKQGGLKFGLLSCRLIFLLIYFLQKTSTCQWKKEAEKPPSDTLWKYEADSNLSILIIWTMMKWLPAISKWKQLSLQNPSSLTIHLYLLWFLLLVSI